MDSLADTYQIVIDHYGYEGNLYDTEYFVHALRPSQERITEYIADYHDYEIEVDDFHIEILFSHKENITYQYVYGEGQNQSIVKIRRVKLWKFT